MENKRDFKGVWIPREVWLDKRLNALDKVILTEIDSLDNEEDGCFANNEYLAEFCQCSTKTVTRAITKLKICSYVYEKSFNGRQRLLKSSLDKMSRQPRQNVQADYSKCPGSIIKDNNINNNINNNIEDYIYIINYLNRTIGSHYRYQSRATQRLIKARLNEGYTREDFETVIDKKASKWKGTEMEQYLRPETLFGTKFEGYLNEKETKTEPKKKYKVDNFEDLYDHLEE